jgi:hypothetical protein
MANTAELILEAKDHASKIIGNVTDLLGGALTIGVGAAAAGFAGLTAAVGLSIKEAMEAQEIEAMLDVALRSTGEAAAEQAAQWQAAQGQIVTSIGLTGDALTTLQDDYRLTEIAIAKQQAKMEAISAEHGTANTVYEEEAIKLKRLQQELSGLSAELSNAGPKTMSLVDALGLVPPVAQITKEKILELASELQRTTRFTDDMVISAQTMLLKFENIGADIFPDVTRAVADMATAMGMDLGSAAQMVGKALENPVQGISLLGRVLGRMTKEQQDSIKAMYESGDVMGAQMALLDQLESKFGGAAEASGKTFAGQLDILKNNLLDVAEGIGKKLLPSIQDTFSKISPIILDVAETLSKNFDAALYVLGPRLEELGDSIGGLFSTIGELLGLDFSNFSFQAMLTTIIGVIADVVDAATEFTGWMNAELPGAVETANTAWQSFLDFIQPIIDGVQSFIGSIQSAAGSVAERGPQMAELWGKISKSVQEMWAIVGPVLVENLGTAISTAGELIESLAKWWSENFNTISGVTQISWIIVSDTIIGAITLISGVIAAALQLIQGDWRGAWETILETVSSILNAIAESMDTSLTEIGQIWTEVWELLKVIVAQGTMNITSGIQDWLINLINDLRAKLGDALQFGIDFANNIILGVLQMAGQIAQVAHDVVVGAVSAAASALGGAAAAGAAATGGGFQNGGFTGFGSSNEIAGVVHRNEFVVPQGGALVMRGGGASVGTVNINIDGAGDPASVARAVIRELQMRDLIPATSVL